MILGTRGIPAQHGGFETFAEGFALDMVKRGWHVTVYCHTNEGEGIYETYWQGIRCLHVVVKQGGSLGTILFDIKSVLHSIKEQGVVLTLGYNTAALSIFHRLAGQFNVMNMDGIEWKRAKWSLPHKLWLYCNEWLGTRLANHLIADNPHIKQHLLRHTRAEKITVIPYCAEPIPHAPVEPLSQYGLSAGNYAIVIARAEPENSILEIIRGYVAASLDMPLVVLGSYDVSRNAYHRKVIEAASDKVLFLGAIYQQTIVQALRYHARVYLHGHTVGGTNPSLVEAMAAGNPVIAHDNLFNQWVLGNGGMYFSDESTLRAAVEMCADMDIMRAKSAQIVARYKEAFQPDMIHDCYEQVLQRMA